MMQEFDVFVSYASAHLELVAPCGRLLKNDGFKIWFDKEQMAGRAVGSPGRLEPGAGNHRRRRPHAAVHPGLFGAGAGADVHGSTPSSAATGTVRSRAMRN
jgi:hypothetical protein